MIVNWMVLLLSVLLLSVLGSVQVEVIVLEQQFGKVVCPFHSYLLTCQVSARVNSITWKYGCHNELGALTTSSVLENTMTNFTCMDENVTYVELFTFERTTNQTVSNLTIIGQTTSGKQIVNSTSLFATCEEYDPIKEIVISGSPPPPINFSHSLDTHVCNETHYPVTYTWSHPPQNYATTSPIKEYAFIISTSFGNAETLILESNESTVTLWQEYNVTYCISLQSKNCNFTRASSSDSITVLQTTFVPCCLLPTVTTYGEYIIDYDPDTMTLNLECDEDIYPDNEPVQCFCGGDTRWNPDPYSYTCMQSSKSTVTMTSSTQKKATDHHAIIAGACILLLLLVAMVALTLIIFIRVKISHTKLLFRANQVESVYTISPRVTDINQASPQILSVQDENQQVGGNIQYEEIAMRGRPLPEAGNNESSLNQQYSVLSHQIPQYSTLFGHNLHYSNPNELENAQPLGHIQENN